MDYNSTRSFTMTLAHRAVGDIRRGGFRLLGQKGRVSANFPDHDYPSSCAAFFFW